MRAGPAPWRLCLFFFWVSWASAQPIEPSVRIGPISIYDRSQSSERVALGEDVEVPAGTTVRSVVVVAGDARIDGEVTGEVVVVLGGVKLGPAAKVRRELVMIGGPLEEAAGAEVGERVLISWDSGWTGLSWLRDWVRDGLFMARPLPHQHGWAWLVAGIFLLVYLLAAAVLPRPVELCCEALQIQPGAAFVLGLLGFLLVSPLLLLLTVSVVGLLIVPFFLLALLFSLFLGKTAVYQFTGSSLGGQMGVAFFSRPVGGLLLGGVAFSLLYAVPLLGVLVWSLAAIVGLGSVLLVLFRGSGRAHPPVVDSSPASGAFSSAPVADSSGEERPIPESLQLARGGFWIRFWASALDLLVVGLFVTLIGAREFAFLAWVVYHFAFWTWRGTTLGGILMGLRILRTDGQPIDYAVALVRCISALFSAVVLFIGFFWAGWDRNKQAWHDKIAGTVVVQVPKPLLV